jgi:hypothetical protein
MAFLLVIVQLIAAPRLASGQDAKRVKRIDACLAQFIVKGNVGDVAIPTSVETIAATVDHVANLTTAWREFSGQPKDHVAFFAYHLAPCRDLVEYIDIEVSGKPANMTADRQLGRPDSASSIEYRFGHSVGEGRLLRFGYLGVVVKTKGSQRGNVLALRLYCKPFLDSHPEAVRAAEAKRKAAAAAREQETESTTPRKRTPRRRPARPRTR